MKIYLFLMGMSTLVFSGACKTGSTKQPAKPVAVKHHNPPVQTSISRKPAIPVLKDADLQLLLMPYHQLRNALVSGNGLHIKRAALSLAEGASLSGKLNNLSIAATAILQNNNLEVQRAQFSFISNRLIKSIQRTGLKEGTLYIAYCPMALNDRGAYWLTPENRVINPYFGDAMLTCGNLNEVIR